MKSENLLLNETDFVEFQRLCRRDGFDLCYYRPEIPLKRVTGLEDDVVVKVERWRFSSVGVPYEVAEWQRREWRAALPRLKARFFEEERLKMIDEPKPQGGMGDVVKQLSSQLKNAFISSLILLWLSTLSWDGKAAMSIIPFWIWAIALVFILLVLGYLGRKCHRRRLWQVLIFAIVIWMLLYLLVYFLSKIPSLDWQNIVFMVLAAILLLWAISLLIVLIMIRHEPWQKKHDIAIRRLIACGNSNYVWPLNYLVLFAGIFTNLAKLWNSDMSRWLTGTLMMLGMVIFIAVALTTLRQDKDA